MAKLLLVFPYKWHIGVGIFTQRSKYNETCIESQDFRWRKTRCMHIYVCVARVKSKSFVVHKSADSGGDVRTNRAPLLQLAWMKEAGERKGERKGESRTAAVRPPSCTCHTGSERWPLFPGYTSSNTVPGRIRGRTSAARERPTGRFLKNAFGRSPNEDFCKKKLQLLKTNPDVLMSAMFFVQSFLHVQPKRMFVLWRSSMTDGSLSGDLSLTTLPHALNLTVGHSHACLSHHPRPTPPMTDMS